MEEKEIKRWLKRKVRFTLGVMFTFLMTGVISYSEEVKPTTESKAVILGKDSKIGNKHIPDENTEGVAIGEQATIDSQGGNGEHYSVAIGRKARVGSNGIDFSSIAFGDNAYVLNGSGKQEKVLSFGNGKYAGGIAIGTNSYARTGSIQLGSHTYSGVMGGIEVNNITTNKEANIVNMTTIGTNSYQKAANGTVVGAYNISTGGFTGNGGFNSLKYGSQNFGSSIFGTLNSIRSNGNSGTSGVANSIVGIANITEDANGSLVFGAGNVIRHSNESLNLTNTVMGSFENADKAVEKFQKGIKASKSGGATMTIGGGNTAEYTKQVTIIGINNTVLGTKDKKSESQMILGANNKVNQASNGVILGTNYTVEKDNNILLGFNKEENKINVGNVLALGNDIKVATENSVYLGNESQNADNYRTIFGNKDEYTGILKDMHFAGKTDYGILSIGSEGKERVLQNVAPGLIDDNSTDAINGSQLSQVIKNNKFYITKNGQKYEIRMGDTLNLDGSTLGLRSLTLRNAQDREAQSSDYLDKEKQKLVEKYVNTNDITNETLNHYYNNREFSKYRVFFDPSQSVWNNVAPATIIEGSEFDKMFRNVFANVNGRINTMKSSIMYAGVANSITGVANTVDNSNGTLIYGAGNKVSKSYLPVDVDMMTLVYNKVNANADINKEITSEEMKKQVSELIKMKKENPEGYNQLLLTNNLDGLADLAEKFIAGQDQKNHLQKLLSSMINEDYSGGATLVIGGGNEADTTRKIAIVGAANKVKNAENTFVTGFNNKVIAEDNKYEKDNENGKYVKVDNGYVEVGNSGLTGMALMGTDKYKRSEDNHIENNIITGSNYTVEKGNNILLGFNKKESKVSVGDVVALGNDITISSDNSVYLGSKSGNSNSHSIWSLKTDRAEGAKYEYVKQDFSKDTDLKDVFTKDTVFQGTVGVNGMVSIGLDNSERVLQNVAAGKISNDSTDAINGSQLYALAKTVGELKSSQGQGGTPGQPGQQGKDGLSAYEVWKKQSGNESKTEKDFFDSLKGAKGDKGDPGASLNYVTLDDEGKKVSKNTQLTNITFGGLDVKVEDTKVKSTDGNSDVTVQKITFSANGKVEKDNKNLVDGGTVYDAISKMSDKIDKKAELALGGVSNAVAMANLPQVSSYSRHRHNLSAAYGYYGGAHALAVGFSGTNEKRNFVYKLSGSVNNRGNLALGLGLGVMLGKEDNEYPNKTAEVEALMTKVDNLEKSNEQLRRENREIKEMLHKLFKK